jgi:hypothetical protein
METLEVEAASANARVIKEAKRTEQVFKEEQEKRNRAGESIQTVTKVAAFGASLIGPPAVGALVAKGVATTKPSWTGGWLRGMKPDFFQNTDMAEGAVHFDSIVDAGPSGSYVRCSRPWIATGWTRAPTTASASGDRPFATHCCRTAAQIARSIAAIGPGPRKRRHSGSTRPTTACRPPGRRSEPHRRFMRRATAICR